MRILLTGATGYVGKRLLPLLIEQGHTVVCAVRDRARLPIDESFLDRIEILEIDFLDPPKAIPDIARVDAAYYLIHSMSTGSANFHELEARSAENFRGVVEKLGARQVVYLSGIVNERTLSKHLASRKQVEDILGQGNYALTVLRAGIIVGSGSASFEIIRDLTEKLPVMIAPRWLLTRCQPIAIRDVISYLTGVLLREETFDRSFDIGGPDILTYKEMMLGYAAVRGLKRKILIVPLMTPRLSSYWLYIITSVSYPLAINLVNSMKVEVVCKEADLEALLHVDPVGYREAIRLAFTKIEQNLVVSSWKDAFISSRSDRSLSSFIEVPQFGVLRDAQEVKVTDRKAVIERIWSIGGGRGWYYANNLWRFRGFLDKLFGGVGLRRGRRHPSDLQTGDALDFWRVIYANREEGRLLLFAEMRLPGEAWLEFKLTPDNRLEQVATFRPRGVLGRLYWLAMYPFHLFLFKGMARNIAG